MSGPTTTWPSASLSDGGATDQRRSLSGRRLSGRSLSRATDDGAVIREIAVALWDEAALGVPVRLLGVSVSNLEPQDTEQLELFAPPKKDALGPALDAITERFGRNAIHRGARSPEKITHGRGRKPGEH